MKQHALTVAAVERIGTDAALVTFDLPATLAEFFRFRAGQYLTLRVPLPAGEVYRSYSLTSTPVTGEPLRIGIKRVRGGAASGWLVDELRPGSQIDVLPPAGSFTPPDFDQHLLLVAGGSGITPVYSILHTALLSGKARVRLLYANRQRDGQMLLPQLEALATAYRERFDLQLWYDDDNGPPTAATFAVWATGCRDWRAMVCGPAPLMQCAASTLRDAGLAPSAIHLEEFVRPEAALHPPSAAARADGGGERQATVEIAGTSHTLACADGEILLDAMLRAGLQAPYSCRSGNCAACLCSLVSGEVERLEDTVLGDDDVAAGELLACRTIPRSSQVHVRFSL